MITKLVPVTLQERSIVENLFQYYLYELSGFTGVKINPQGAFNFNASSLDEYWTNPDKHAFIILCEDEVAGFSLLRRYPNEPTVYDIDQFFILKKFNGKGVGRDAFRLSTSLFPGQWMTRVLHENDRALKFWLKVISEATDGNYELAAEIDVDLSMNFIRYEISAS